MTRGAVQALDDCVGARVSLVRRLCRTCRTSRTGPTLGAPQKQALAVVTVAKESGEYNVRSLHNLHTAGQHNCTPTTKKQPKKPKESPPQLAPPTGKMGVRGKKFVAERQQMSSPGAEPCGEEFFDLSAEKRGDQKIIRRNSPPPRPAYHGQHTAPGRTGRRGVQGGGR